MVKKPTNSGKPWTNQAINKLKELAKGNTPTPLIGWELGRTTDAIYQKASKEGIPLTPTNQSPYNRRKK